MSWLSVTVGKAYLMLNNRHTGRVASEILASYSITDTGPYLPHAFLPASPHLSFLAFPSCFCPEVTNERNCANSNSQELGLEWGSKLSTKTHLAHFTKGPEAPGFGVDVSGQLQDTLTTQQPRVFHLIYVIKVTTRNC